MISDRKCLVILRRGIPAGVIACLLILQLLTNAAVAQLHTAGQHGLEAASSFSIAGICTDHDEDTPLRKHHKNSGCCLFCKAGGRENPFLLPLIALALIVAVDRPTYADAIGFIDEPAREPIGWASSWSSRAPPADHTPGRS